jgi:hypothetical protein
MEAPVRVQETLAPAPCELANCSGSPIAA